ncbi:MAG: hypothetical protein Q4E69_07460 [Bacilli bacterium]|nr:hypothetical protein [Bacilli bacterium]
MRDNVVVGEVIKPTIPSIELEDKAKDIMMHPLVLVYYDGMFNKLFHLTSNKDFNSILSGVISYKLTPGVNISYNSQIVEMNTYVRCDQVHELTMNDLYTCRRFFAFLTPDTKSVIEDIVANHYFIYDFLKKNEVLEESHVSEELVDSIFNNKYEIYNNRRYKILVNTLLDRRNYISFIKDVNHEYHTNLDVESTYYNYLQDVKNAYMGEEKGNRRVA